jgi:hypothetical protein
MTVYINHSQDSPIASVEFQPTVDGTVCFFHLKNEGGKQTLAAAGADQNIVTRTSIDGHTLLIARADKTPEELLQDLNARGGAFTPLVEEKKFNPWKWRGITSIVGQSLQLTSSIMSKGNKSSGDKIAIGGFATSNLIANGFNIVFGSQKKEDPHQLRVLKESFNKKYATYLPEGETFPGVVESRASLRPEADKEQTFGQKAYAVGQKYSVTGGEIGLRFLGSASLSFPVTKWGKGFQALKDGRPTGSVLNEIKNDNPATYKVGLLMLLGKITSFFSKEPDPFNPKPPSLLDKFREKITFPLSSIIEGGAAALMMRDRYKNQKVMFRGKEYRDWPGVIGNLVFIGGYVIRLFASYGSLEVNMKELNAHISDGLAKLPREKISEALAQVALDLKHHFGAKAPEISKLYADILMDLKHHHHIDLMATPEIASPVQKSKPTHATHLERVVASSIPASIGVGL